MADVELLGDNDFLGKAANAKNSGKEAMKPGNFDEAWKQFHIQKENYLPLLSSYKRS